MGAVILVIQTGLELNNFYYFNLPHSNSHKTKVNLPKFHNAHRRCVHLVYSVSELGFVVKLCGIPDGQVDQS